MPTETNISESLVWYACYGSNFRRERFMCYIRGGRPEGSSRTHTGCSDRSPPVRESIVTIPHRLYFAGSAGSWSGGGVAFLETKRCEPGEETLGRMYLVTREQFTEIFAQENGIPVEKAGIDFERLVEKGALVVGSDWYGYLIHLGNEEGYPVLTFTVDDRETRTDLPRNSPGKEYFDTIAKGLCETYPGMDREAARQYLEKRIDGERGANFNDHP